MPLWARFLAAAVAGGATALGSLLVAAYWREGSPPGFWEAALQFAGTAAFWRLGRAALLLAAAAVLAGRFLAHMGHTGPVAGAAVAGAVFAFAWALGLVVLRSASPLAFLLRLAREAPEALLLCLPFALGGVAGSLTFDALGP